MPEDLLLRERSDDGVLLLTLNRPEKKNAFHDPLWDALRDALDAACRDPQVAVVVVTGAGKDFSAGQDLAAFGAATEPRADGHPNGYAGCMEALVAFDKPLLAAARALPDSELLEATLAKAREIARFPVSALQATKRTLQRVHAAGIRAALEAENAGMAALAGSPENVEAIRAFLEKRPPDFLQFRK